MLLLNNRGTLKKIKKNLTLLLLERFLECIRNRTSVRLGKTVLRYHSSLPRRWLAPAWHLLKKCQECISRCASSLALGKRETGQRGKSLFIYLFWFLRPLRYGVPIQAGTLEDDRLK
uniref:Uncharacterized protein n=1 Tax=Micrurus surinamensis TaxID=129470 RepID=A0A2D4NPW7_MICSU